MADVSPSKESWPDVPTPGLLDRIASILALVGGWSLCALAVMQVTSIVLRAVTGSPIPGDFELIQLGTAVIVFCFLPITQLRRYNFTVTFLTDWLPRRMQARLALLGSVLMLLIAALLAWRTPLGAVDLRRVQEHTMILEIPIWWAFIPISIALLCLVIASLAAVLQDLRGSKG